MPVTTTVCQRAITIPVHFTKHEFIRMSRSMDSSQCWSWRTLGDAQLAEKTFSPLGTGAEEIYLFIYFQKTPKNKMIEGETRPL